MMERGEKTTGKLALGIFAFIAGFTLVGLNYTLIGFAVVGLSMWLLATI